MFENSIIDVWLGFGPTVHILLAGVFGLAIGSFLNVVIVRLPKLLAHRYEAIDSPPPPNLIRPRSRCVQCEQPIAWYDNLPLISWMVLGGRCRACRQPIGVRYPIVEAITAVVWMVVVWQLGPTWPALMGLIFSSYLIAATAIDFEHQILPDSLTLSILWLGLITNATFSAFATPTEAIYGAAAGYASLWLVFHGFYWLTGKEGLGFGDLKLLAGLGAWVGWALLPFILFLGSVLGTLAALFMMLKYKQSKDVPIAFGPYLAIAGWIALLWGESVMQWLFPI